MLPPGKGSDNPDSTDIFLEGGAQPAFTFIGLTEDIFYFQKENVPEEKYCREHGHGYPGEGRIERGHEKGGEDNQENSPADFHRLGGQKTPDSFHITGAALNQISGVGLHMVFIIKVLQVAVQTVAYPSGRIFSGYSRPTAFEVEEQSGDTHQYHRDSRRREKELLYLSTSSQVINYPSDP